MKANEYLSDKKLMPNFQKHSIVTPVRPTLRDSVPGTIESIPTYFILKAQKIPKGPSKVDDQIDVSYYSKSDNNALKSEAADLLENKEDSDSTSNYQYLTTIPSYNEIYQPTEAAIESPISSKPSSQVQAPSYDMPIPTTTPKPSIYAQIQKILNENKESISQSNDEPLILE